MGDLFNMHLSIWWPSVVFLLSFSLPPDPCRGSCLKLANWVGTNYCGIADDFEVMTMCLNSIPRRCVCVFAWCHSILGVCYALKIAVPALRGLFALRLSEG